MNNSPIYKAQCFGNVEPNEYMVPYPNLRSLAVGQCVKFAQNILFSDFNISNADFLKSINKTANWLVLKGIKKSDRILVRNISSPMIEILSYAIWSIGATLVIIDKNQSDKSLNAINPKFAIGNISEKDKLNIDQQSDIYIETSTTLLPDEAVIYFTKNRGIRLSHYNLLINTYGGLKHLNILYTDKLKIDLPLNTTAAIVLKTILPLYAGTTISDNSPNITFSSTSAADYHVIFNWTKLIDTSPQSLYILPETTAILAIGKTPNHILKIIDRNDHLEINGHSVMMGYLDEQDDQRVFIADSLVLKKESV